MSNLRRCSWKLVDPSKFVMGQDADRCGFIADVVVLRPNRKTDLFLCEQHVNEFIKHWGLHNEIGVLCKCEEETREIKCHKCHGEGLVKSWPGRERCDYCDGRGFWWGNEQFTCDDPNCKKCIQDDPKTWRHS